VRTPKGAWVLGGVLVGTAAGFVGAQPVFHRVGVLNGGSSSEVWAVSRDGTAVVGDSSVHAFRWTPHGGIVGLGSIPGFPDQGSIAWTCSQDGQTAAGVAGDTSFVWTPWQGMRDAGALVSLARPRCRATSGDGSFLVMEGVADGHSSIVRWSAASGAVALWPLPTGFASAGAAWSISADGRYVVGAVVRNDGITSEPFVWSLVSGFQPLGDLREPCAGAADARAISADGRTVVGEATGPDPHTCLPEAFRWTADTGMRGLGVPAPQTGTIALAVTAEGSVVSGQVLLFNGGPHACIWMPGAGPRYLDEFLYHEYGVGVSGWDLYDARVSADGTAIAGTGRSPEGHPEGWVVTGLHLVCRPDLDRDGRVSLPDFLQMLAYYASGDTRADVLIDGSINIQDFLEFLRLYAAGCG
jgi:hypothetical protein